MPNPTALWQRYNQYLCPCPGVGITLDVSRMSFGDDFLSSMASSMNAALDAMAGLEAGQIANPDENRMVGHYWLRDATRAPNDEIANQIKSTLDAIKQFTHKVHNPGAGPGPGAGAIKPTDAGRFTDLLVIGIGGSALGPQLVADALGGRGGVTGKRDRLRVHFFDNTDPDGMNRTVAELGVRVKGTLTVVISKSGGTKETRNGMLAAEAAYKSAGLSFARHAVAITGEGSKLDQHARKENWLARFPMWDWVGGRTSITSAVGLLPAALQGLDIDALLKGAAEMDRLTRSRDVRANPAALLALMWHHATGGRGQKDMVILPYMDRLLLMSRYLQQLVMESLGKEKTLDGDVVHQGIAVYGNKGSTDQHAYVQQLREGVNNFFATFIVCLLDVVGRPGRDGARTADLQVDPDTTCGDYLSGFWQGTREALCENGRGSITITLDKLDAHRLGALIALYERAVGLYAQLVHINAYHQPGVEAGKKAAEAVLDVQARVIAHVRAHPDEGLTAASIAAAVNLCDRVETIHHILQHLSANRRFIKRVRDKYQAL